MRAKNLSKTYPAPNGQAASLEVFRQLHIEVAAGEMVGVMGRSGTGKSSLLHLLAGLDRPSSGEVWLAGLPLHKLPPGELALVRNRKIGYVWQFHYLLPEFTALENVAMPLLARRVPRQDALSVALQWLERVEVQARARHRPGELSGGEQQRVAIARALVGQPVVLLADEPTGDLDGETATQLFELLRRLCAEERLGAVLVTHSEEMAARCDRLLRLVGGHLEPIPVPDSRRIQVADGSGARESPFER